MRYPHVVPIFDRMVLQAVGVNDNKANQSEGVFRRYLPHAWGLADRHGKHAQERFQFQETPLRLVDMALWVKRGDGRHAAT